MLPTDLPGTAPSGGMGPFWRLLFAAIGLAADDAALLVFLISNALRLRAALLKAHLGKPDLQLPQAWRCFDVRDILCAWVLSTIRPGWQHILRVYGFRPISSDIAP